MFLLHKLRAKAEGFPFEFDSLTKPKTVVTEREIYDYLSQENGMIRLKRAFDRSNGELSPELKYYFDNFANGTSAQVIFFATSLFAINRNRKLLPANLPKDQLYKTLFRNSAKDAVLNSVRFFTTFTVFFGITETIAIYRNKTSPVEFSVVGALMAGTIGGLRYHPKPPELPKDTLKKPLKPVSRLVAIRNSTISGAIVGLLMGCMLTYLARQADTSIEKRHFWNVQTKLHEEKEKELGLQDGADRNE